MAPGKQILRLNLDETACKMHYTPPSGLVARDGVNKRRLPQLYQNLKRAQMRSAVSHIALICDNTEIQALLPQYIIGNERLLRVEMLNELQVSLQPNVAVVRRRSSWVTGHLMRQLARAYAKTLAPFREKFQPILIMDVCNPHMDSGFLLALSKADIWPLFVPASMTWLLQPCDTHLFSKYKSFLAARYHEELLRSSDGCVSTRDMIACMSDAVRLVLQSFAWAPSFIGNGFDRGQRQLREKIKQELQWLDDDAVDGSLPSLESLRALFPQKRFIPLAELFHCFRPPRGRAGAAVVAELPAAPPVVDASEAWPARLRPRDRNLGPPEPFRAQCFLAPPELAAPLPPLPPPACHPNEEDGLHRAPRGLVPVGRPLLPRSRSRMLALAAEPPVDPGA